MASLWHAEVGTKSKGKDLTAKKVTRATTMTAKDVLDAYCPKY